jgi:hypothetical protein
VAGGCGDDDLVWSTGEAAADKCHVPAGHFADQVAAGAGAADVLNCGGSAVAVLAEMVEVADWSITRQIYRKCISSSGSSSTR